MSRMGKQDSAKASGSKPSEAQRLLSKEKILTRLPRSAFSFAKEEKKATKTKAIVEEKPVTEAMGLDLSDLQAHGLELGALASFPTLRRLNLKGNEIRTLVPGCLPSTLSYLDLSSNAQLNDLSFLKGLKSLTTLILSNCPGISESLNLEGDCFKDCTALKVLVIDHCRLKGDLSIRRASFVKGFETLIVSHNYLLSIDVKHAANLRKLSAGHNPSLKIIKHLNSLLLAEVRLGDCASLESLKFLAKSQRKLALLDLSGCVLIKKWSDLSELLATDSLLTLSLKDTPLRQSIKSREQYERECIAKLKCKKLRTLDFAKITSSPNAKIEDESGSSEGEDFKALISSDDEADDEPDVINEVSDVVEQLETSEPANEDVDGHEDVMPSKKLKVRRDDEGLFEGKGNGW